MRQTMTHPNIKTSSPSRTTDRQPTPPRHADSTPRRGLRSPLRACRLPLATERGGAIQY
nr:MAG TPA: hypothetical protein [Caudoviricetes sp.]